MPTVTQPEGLSSLNGYMVTIGIRANGDRCAIVLPMVADSINPGPNSLGEQCCEDMEAHLFTKLADCLSSDAYISFVQAEGMLPGALPYRLDYAPADYPGTRAAGCETSQIGGLIGFYSHPDDLQPGQRVRVGKNFIPGIADGDLTGDAIAAGLTTALDGLAEQLAEGVTSDASGGGKWYRVISRPADHVNPSNCIRAGFFFSRGYSATQRRRLLPH